MAMRTDLRRPGLLVTTLSAVLGAVLALALLIAPSGAATEPDPAARLSVSGLTVEQAAAPIGLDVERPRLSWIITSAERGVVQEAYQVRVGASRDGVAAGDAVVWDSGRVESNRSTLVDYAGPDLAATTAYYWQVRVWDTAGRHSGWSDVATWETGLMGPAGWGAEWIGMPAPTESWTDYDVTTTVRVTSEAAGLFFRANGPGNAYMWQFSITGGAAKLRPHVRRNGAWTLIKEVPLGEVVPATELNDPHEMRISAVGDTITTWIDGVEVDVTRDATHSGGSIGLRTSGPEAGVFSGLSVTSGGATLFESDLAGENPFSAGTATPDGVSVSGNTEAMLVALDAAPLMRRTFDVDGEVERARVYASALGVYELSINGERVGDHELAPGWTDYDQRVQYQTYDVTEQLAAGTNVIGAMLGDGWYSGTIAWFGTDNYGSRPHLSAQLVIDYADGRTETVATDDSWRVSPGPFVQSDLIHGESYDARRLPDGWDRPGFDDGQWPAATVDDVDATSALVAQADPPVRVVEELPARSVTQSSPGTWVFDLGQNMVGKVRLRVDGEAGQTVRIRHAEVLDPDGSVYTANLRSAKATDHYTLRGGGEEVYEPTFTFHGFRYVELTGYPGTPGLDAVTGLVMHTDGDLTSEFETSDPMIDQLHSNITWGQRGNFLSIPTDTPARDERLGWTGDINVFAETATFNMNSLTFLTKWLRDLRDAQSENGAYPDVAPRACCGDGATGWADAGITVPHTLWQRYGDTRVIEENYAAMVRYAGWLESTSTNHLRPNAGPYLDWLNLDDPTPAGVIGTAYYAYSIGLLGEMAAAIGEDADAARYRTLSAAVADAFVGEYVSADGTVRGDSQTGYVLAIGMDLLPDDLRAKAADKLVANIERHDWHLATGFLGTPDLLPALADTGHLDVAYRLLTNDTYPSWGYEIDRGATTIWERWNSIMPDGGFGDASMNSFNHYAYGAVGDWMYRTVAGIAPDAAAPGYEHLTIAPQPGGGLTSARATYDSIRGEIATAWRLDAAGDMSLDVTVPGNTTATVRIPATSRYAITEGGAPVDDVDGVEFVEIVDGVAVLEVGSGTYDFVVDRVRGELGEAGAAVARLAEVVAGLADVGVAAPVVDHLTAQVSKMAREIAAAQQSYASGAYGTAAADAHRALATGADLDRWITTQVKLGRLAEDAGTHLAGLLAETDERLSTVSSALVGAVARLELPVGENLPGDTVRADVVITNGGTGPLTGVSSTLVAPDGWGVTPARNPATTVEPGSSITQSYTIQVPPTQGPGAVQVTGSVGYRYQEGTARVPVSGTLTVLPAVTVVSVATDPAGVAPGEAAVVRTVLRNRAGVPASGELTTTAPEGWSVDPATRDYNLAPGAEAALESTITAPLTITESPATVTVATGPSEAERASTTVSVRLDTPPAGALDHVDLGDTASEQAHGLVASAHSGTNIEAGLTRRYTNVTYPGGYFEVDLAVAPGEPFILRAVETYDQAQLKDYDILVGGAVVHSRSFRRSAGGPGTVTYQVVVDAAHADPDGTVRVRFQDTGDGYDPSIADVWSIPSPQSTGSAQDGSF